MKVTPKTIAAGAAAIGLVWAGSVLTAPPPDRAPAPDTASTATPSAATPRQAPPRIPAPLLTLPTGPLAVGPGQAATQVATATPTAKTGAATCALAASALASALTTPGDDAAWVKAMRPVVTGRIESVLGSVDRSAIPAGKATVGAVWEQPGSCDAILQWPNVAWSVTFTDEGAGYLAEDWRPA